VRKRLEESHQRALPRNMKSAVLRLLNPALRRVGLVVQRSSPGAGETYPPDADESMRATMSKISGCTMTTREGQATLINAVRYIHRNGLPGAFVECGVWRGGSSMAMALTLLQESAGDRDLFLYDTFEGMTQPSSIDRTHQGVLASEAMESDVEKTGVWCVASLEDVQRNMRSTGYSEKLLHFVKGSVEQTVPAQAPDGPIALLRLDTDWYESTMHELTHLYPRLVSGGVLIIDDYGFWEGARKAVDEYFAGIGKSYYLHRVDRSARVLVKP
jgi:O-methyltransferase